MQSNAHWNHSTIFVDDDFSRDRMYVSMNITHKRAGAVKLVLRAKRDGEKVQQIRLKSYGHGGKGSNFVDTTFDDDASEHFPIWASEAPFMGDFQPDVALHRITGPAAAKWTLLALNRDGHTAKIDSWWLTFCENRDPRQDRTSFQDIANAQGITITPPAYQPAPHQPPAHYSGPNFLFDKRVRQNFWRTAVEAFARTTANYNSANYYVNQVKVMQKAAKLAGEKLVEAKENLKHHG